MGGCRQRSVLRLARAILGRPAGRLAPPARAILGDARAVPLTAVAPVSVRHPACTAPSQRHGRRPPLRSPLQRRRDVQHRHLHQPRGGLDPGRPMPATGQRTACPHPRPPCRLRALGARRRA
eukprot:scaffold19386_cov136-Isochrysis_galbana.AAC.1